MKPTDNSKEEHIPENLFKREEDDLYIWDYIDNMDIEEDHKLEFEMQNRNQGIDLNKANE